MRQKQGVFSLFLLSPSSRRAWIEIQMINLTKEHPYVALLAEGVDRNLKWFHSMRLGQVALLAEGVDRNALVYAPMPQKFVVALLAEGVDRNSHKVLEIIPENPSPSSRRAWIEIFALLFAFFGSSCRPPRGGRG